MKKTPAPHPLLDHPWVKPGLWLLARAVARFFLWDDIDRRELVGAIVFLLIFIVSVIVLIPHARQRTKKFKQVAGQMGMKFWRGDSALPESLSAFELFFPAQYVGGFLWLSVPLVLAEHPDSTIFTGFPRE